MGRLDDERGGPPCSPPLVRGDENGTTLVEQTILGPPFCNEHLLVSLRRSFALCRNLARRSAKLLRYATLAFPLAASAQTIVYVDHNAVGSGDGSSWSDAYNDLANALLVAQRDSQVWVAQGSYQPGTSRADMDDSLRD